MKMSRRKVTRRERNMAKRLKIYELRTAKKREQMILKVYIYLSEEIEKQLLKSESDLQEKIGKIVKEKFQPRLKVVLDTIAELNINDFVDFFVEKFQRTLNLEELQNIKSRLLNKFLTEYTGKTVTKVSNTTIRQLNKLITQYTQEGYSFRDLVKKIVEDTKGVIGKKRAAIIARTETSKAISITNYRTALKAKLTEKKWIHLGGGITNRESHLQMDGVTIGIRKKFDVPGEGKVPPVKMRFPKDPECPVAGHIVNCYCGIYYF